MRETPEDRKKRQKKERGRLVRVLRAAGNIVREEQEFHGSRSWRFDIAILRSRTKTGTLKEAWVALEIEGLYGRHQRTAGFLNDLEKYNEATLLGWRVLRVTTRDVASGDALQLLHRAGVPVEARR